MCLKEKIWRTIACAALLNNKLAPLAQESPSQNGLVAGRVFWRSVTMCLPAFCILAEGSAVGQSRRQDIVYQHFIQLRTASLVAFYPKLHNPAAHRCRSGDIQRMTVKEQISEDLGRVSSPISPLSSAEGVWEMLVQPCGGRAREVGAHARLLWLQSFSSWAACAAGRGSWGSSAV